MEFLGGPEDEQVEAYVAALEARIKELESPILDMLKEAELQLQYLHERHQPHSSTEAVLSRVRGLLKENGYAV